MKKKKKKLTYTLLSLLLATIFGFSSFSFFATNTSKELYFASEIAFTRISSKEYNADWVSDPFIVDPEQVEDYRKVYNDDTLVPGNVYQVRVVDGKEQAVCLASGEYTSRSVAGSDLYLASGKNVYLMDLFTLKKELIYEGSESVSSVQATSDLAFFKAGDSVYRYYKPSGSVDFILTVGEVFDWFPVSNQAICVMTENPDFIEAVQAAGCSMYEKVPNPDAFAEWLHDRFGVELCSDNELLMQCDLENVLASCGIYEFSSYWYNSIEKKMYDSYHSSLYEQDSSALNRAVFSSVLNNQSRSLVANPLWEFSTGQYFSKNKYTGCECHPGCSPAVSCDCLLEDGGIQCNGYARLLFQRYSGLPLKVVPSWGDDARNYWYLSDMTEEMLRYNLLNLPLPILIFMTESGNEDDDMLHYILINDTDENGIYFHEANVYDEIHGKGCLVSNGNFRSYSDLLNYHFRGFVDVAYPAEPHSHTVGLVYDDSSHYYGYTCSRYLRTVNGERQYMSCDAELSDKEPHSLLLNAADAGHWRFCSCGYVSDIEDHEYDEYGHCIICGW